MDPAAEAATPPDASEDVPMEAAGDTGRPKIVEQWTSTFKAQFDVFLRTFGAPEEVEASEPAGGGPVPRSQAAKYEALALKAAEGGVRTLYVDLLDMTASQERNALAFFIRKSYLALSQQLNESVEVFTKATLGKFGIEGPGEASRFFCSVFNAPLVYSVRSLRSSGLGRLTSLRGTVTRTSDIRPELLYASFDCETCGAVIHRVEQQYRYTEPALCPSKGCGNRTKWAIRMDSCEFADWQKIRLQENASEIPAGSMPRTIDVIARNDNCERCKAGDKVLISGSLIAIPDVPSLLRPREMPRAVKREKSRSDRSEYGLQNNAVRGLRALGVRDLGYRMAFLASDIQVVNAVAVDVSGAGVVSLDDVPRGERIHEAKAAMDVLGLDAETQERFFNMAHSQNCLDKLARNIMPAIYGHDDVKKGVLMMLVGGVEKSTEKEHIKLRGDINMCIVGDPGTAKSQILKYVQLFAGRAVYASGKSSTAAGLTASVHKDAEQGDSVIEAGALMLADRGICCIDEFDKMDEKDMVAIHEAMEQQTISIAKAGIQATLNARASVLAACNPAMGRYDPSKTFRQNVRLSAPIMSRFDLFFVLIDDSDQDEIIAKHIARLHADADGYITQAQEGAGLFSTEVLQKFLRVCRGLRPMLTDEAKEILVRAYMALRQQDVLPGSSRNVRITVRQLESLVRLSEAVAKLRFSNQVLASHVAEAYSVFHNSLTKVKRDHIDLNDDLDDDEEGDEEGGGDAQHGSSEARRPGETDEVYRDRQKKDREALRIDAAEFERIACLIIDHLRAMELQEASGEPAIVSRDDLITWFIDEHTPEPESEEELAREFRKLQRIVTRMAQRDFTLIEERRDVEVPVSEDSTETEVRAIVTVRLHPNYAADPAASYGGLAGVTAHANLPQEFFTGQQTTAEAQWSDAMGDDEFVSFMYATGAEEEVRNHTGSHV